MKNNKKLYAAYGSNMHQGQMTYRCPNAEVVGVGTLHEHRLCFKGRAGNAHATVIPDKTASVPLLLWNITASDEKALDRYEGVGGGYYYKATVQVEMENGEKADALIYIMSPNPFNIPSLGYYETIESGYNQSALPIATLKQALRFTDECMKELI